jgi:hypothetical protein
MSNDDIALQVVAAYTKGGRLDEYERQAAKIALERSRNKEPQQAYSIACQFLGKMLSRAEYSAQQEMIDLARKYPLDPDRCRIADALADSFTKEIKP